MSRCARRELEREVHPPQRAGRIVRQREEHDARLGARRSRASIAASSSSNRGPSGTSIDRQPARDRGELVVDERRHRIEDRARERVAQHRDQLVRAVAEHELLAARRRDCAATTARSSLRAWIGIALERDLREHRAELRRGARPASAIRQLVRVELRADLAAAAARDTRSRRAALRARDRRERSECHWFACGSAPSGRARRGLRTVASVPIDIGVGERGGAACTRSSEVRLRKSCTPSGEA